MSIGAPKDANLAGFQDHDRSVDIHKDERVLEYLRSGQITSEVNAQERDRISQLCKGIKGKDLVGSLHASTSSLTPMRTDNPRKEPDLSPKKRSSNSVCVVTARASISSMVWRG